MIQAMGGIMDLTGTPDGPPEKVGVAYVDIFTGMYAVVAIQAALLHREKTGEGQFIDMALLDTQVSVLANQAMNYLASGAAPRRMGNAHPNIVPYQEFAVADGHLIIAAGNDGHFRQLCAVVGAADLSGDPRFAANESRVVNRATLIPKLQEKIKPFARDALLALLEKAGVPAGPINTVAQVFADPQVVHRGMRMDLPLAGGATVPSVRSPIIMSGSPLTYERASPRLGEHTDAILAGLGYDPAAIAMLKSNGVIGGR
jgi:crotonobetainyl-CoA:carnitine CoA-transferase CaiB-like acyl-CoA transferase